MEQDADATMPRKEAMKRLRESRKKTVEQAAARMKEQKKAIDSIKAELLKTDGTIPELAAATGIPSASVLWFIAALKKYGQVVEGGVDGSYIRYQLAGAGNTLDPQAEQPMSDEQ